MASTAVADKTARPLVAIVIDDIGFRLKLGLEALSLPASPITYAILPHTPYGVKLANIASARQQPIILHLPMEPVGDHKDHEGMLKSPMNQSQFIKTIRNNFDAIPHLTGFNNHMGSKLTQTKQPMNWLMEYMGQHTDFFFLDSLTTHRSVAQLTAQEHQVPSIKRDIFLDHTPTLAAIEKQFAKLLSIAQTKGYAVAIGHPYPETLAILKRYLPQLSKLGFQLATLPELIAHRRDVRTRMASRAVVIPADQQAAEHSRP